MGPHIAGGVHRKGNPLLLCGGTAELRRRLHCGKGSVERRPWWPLPGALRAGRCPGRCPPCLLHSGVHCCLDAGRASDLRGADIEVPMVVNGQPQYQLVLQEGINRYVFGEGLNPLEQEWLAAVINEHLDENRGRARELEGFVDASPAALPESTSSAAGGQRYSDFLTPAQRHAEAAEQAARAAGWQAQQAGERAAAAARRAGEQAAADVERSAGRFRGSAWCGKQRQRQYADDDDDDFFNL